MSHQFKVGDKGKTKFGSDYEILAVTSMGGEETFVFKVAGPFDEYVSCVPVDDAAEVFRAPVQTRTVWLNVYPDFTAAHDTERRARNVSHPDAIAVAVPVTFEITPKE